MISNAIIKHIQPLVTTTTLKIGQNLFAENSPSNTGVLVKQAYSNIIDQIDINVRKSIIRVFISGYSVADGNKIAQEITKIVWGLKGVISDGDTNYRVMGTSVTKLPEYQLDENVNVFDFTFDVFYNLQ